MRNLLRKLLCLVCALYLSGAHWMLLQTAAWTGMIVSRSQAGSVADAVKSTFDGDHPCRLCTAISKQQQDDQQKVPTAPTFKKGEDLKITLKSDLPLQSPALAAEFTWPLFAPRGELRAEEPATPPPLA